MALLFSVLLGMSVGILGYFSYYFTRGHYVHGAQSLLETELDFIVHMPGAVLDPAQIDTMISRRNLVHQRLYLLLNADGDKLSGNLDHLPDHVGRLSEGVVTFVQGCGAKECFYAARMHTFADGRKLFIAADITQAAEQFSHMKMLSVLSILFMALVIMTSFIISTFVVSRINRIGQTARDIMETGDLSRRISIDTRWDDLSNLAHTLNGLLARIEDLMQGVQRVSDSIAHDLRTPLTRMRNRLEDVLERASASGDKAAQRDAEALVVEAENLLGIFNALLRISNIETRKQRHNFADIAFDELLHDVVELYAPLADDADIALDCEAVPVSVRGDRDMLFQMVVNVLDNAIKFTPKGGRVHVRLSGGKHGSVLTISDTGPGIPDADKEKVFNRFYRADASRSTPGSGLGLSLVRAIVSLHGGDVHITDRDNAPGTQVVMTIDPAGRKITDL